jgi:hypothetical protein
MSFQRNVLTIAIIIFIILMIVIGILMKSAKKSVSFPPQIGACPDYWKSEIRDDISKCFNSQNLGNLASGCNPSNGIDFKSQFKTKKQKCRFAKSCKVEWDGITNVGLC